MSEDWEGLLLIDKPQGPTSHDVVARVRRMVGQRRIGHAGTLDPLACGLLPLVLGRATRLVRFLPHSPKSYSGEMALGLTSDSDDATGAIRSRYEGDLPSADTVRQAAAAFVGPGRQVPPQISARKVGGQRLYRLARRGVHVDAPATPIEVFRFQLEAETSPDRYRFEVEVSGGTYVRALVRDLGARLGCGAVLTALRRTRIGPLSVEEALPIEPEPHAERLRDGLIGLDRMPLDPPPLHLADEDQVRRFAHGIAISAAPEALPDGPVRVLAPAGTLLGMAESRNGQVRPKVVLAPPARRT